MIMLFWLQRSVPSEPIPEWIGTVVVAVFVALAIFMITREKNAWERVADDMGWSFYGTADLLKGEDCLKLRVLRRRPQISGVMQRTVAAGDAVVLECRYSSQRSRGHPVLCLRVPGMRYPAFEMRPEHTLHRIGTHFGYQNLDFDESPRFSKSYLVRGKDEPAVRALFTASRRDFFETREGWCVEGSGEWLAVYRTDRSAKPDQIGAFVDESLPVAEAFL